MRHWQLRERQLRERQMRERQRRDAQGGLYRLLRGGFIAMLALAAAGTEAAAADPSYPSKTITLIVPFAAGGPTDVVARIVGDHMSRSLGQQFVVENIGGAGGTTGMARVAAADPD